MSLCPLAFEGSIVFWLLFILFWKSHIVFLSTLSLFRSTNALLLIQNDLADRLFFVV